MTRDGLVGESSFLAAVPTKAHGGDRGDRVTPRRTELRLPPDSALPGSRGTSAKIRSRGCLRATGQLPTPGPGRKQSGLHFQQCQTQVNQPGLSGGRESGGQPEVAMKRKPYTDRIVSQVSRGMNA